MSSYPHEAYAEKIRAALSRRQAAIRDIYDIDYALKNQLIAPGAVDDLLSKKLTGLESDLSQSKKTFLKKQMETQLKPVLRSSDFEAFDFDEAWARLKQIYQTCFKS